MGLDEYDGLTTSSYFASVACKGQPFAFTQIITKKKNDKKWRKKNCVGE